MASSCSSCTFQSASQTLPSPSPPPPPVIHAEGGSSNQTPSSTFSPSPRVKSCDVYIGFAGRRPLLRRFVKWLQAELETQGVRCFASDRRGCRDALAHGVARAAMEAAAVGLIIVTEKSLSNPYSVEEMRWFLECKRLIPIFFELIQQDCFARDIIERRGEVWEKHGGQLWTPYGGIEEEWRAVVNGISRSPVKLEVNSSNFRDIIFDIVSLLGVVLGRRSIVEKVQRWREMAGKNLPFPRNPNFVGRKAELTKLKMILFGDIESNLERCIEIETPETCKKHTNLTSKSSNRIVKGSKGKNPLWKESDEELEMHDNWPGRYRSRPSSFSKGVACVHGPTGIGKTELLLEFAYQISQSYKMVLWVGGESKYLRQNYLNLLPLLGVDVVMGMETCSQRNGPRSFEEMEEDAIAKVQKELMRGIPFLLVIDNLESEKDWWDGRNIIKFLPRFGSDTHILISSCLPQVFNLKPLNLSYLSSAEAMMLMKGKNTKLTIEDVNALRIIEENLGRNPLGLSIVRALLSELSMDPRALLVSITQMPYRERVWNKKEDLVLKHNPVLVQLLDLCFNILDDVNKPSRLATRMVEMSNWFAPSMIPISMLRIAASTLPVKHRHMNFWNICRRAIPCTAVGESDVSMLEDEAATDLLRLSIARSTTKKGYICFHKIVKLYARKGSNDTNAVMIIKAIEDEGNLLQHANHIWAACFLLFRFGVDRGAVDLPPRRLLCFIRSFALPLALFTFKVLSHCNASLELLRAATEALEAIEDSFVTAVSNVQKRNMCFHILGFQTSTDPDSILYRNIVDMRTILLETRAKFMLQGGCYEIGEELYRTTLSIREVIHGHEHPQT
ncbi:uncharacterized protein LOC122024877 [Zingiber officinale]|nr:uncharacterized protein LOC122024877 [Zingiber officinale]